MAEDVEDELRKALARVPPPEGFAERVLKRLPVAEQRRSRLTPLLAIAAAIVLIAGPALYRHHQEQERERTQKAQQQLAFALRFTAEKLMVVETRLKKSTRHLRITKEEL